MNLPQLHRIKNLPVLKMFRVSNRIFYILTTVLIGGFIIWLQVEYGMAEVVLNWIFRS